VNQRRDPVSPPVGSAPIQLLRWIVGIGVLAWVVRANGGWRVLLLPVEFPAVLAVLTVQVFIGACVEAQRIRMLLEAAVTSIPFSFGYRMVAIATLFNMAIPGGTGGDVLKLVLLSRRLPGKRAEFTAVLLLDRIIGLTSILLVALTTASVALMTGEAPPRLVAIVITPSLLLLAAVVAAVAMASGPSRVLILRLVPERWKRLRGLLDRAYQTAFVMRRQPAVLFQALLISIVGQCIMAASLALASQWLLPGISPLMAAAVAFVGLIVNAIPITPGGIGVGEAAFDALFKLVGFSGGARLLICWRLGQLPFALLGAWYFATHREEMRPVMADAAELQREAEREQFA
jgi:uncharacterized protein (TIRG00374 family)